MKYVYTPNHPITIGSIPTGDAAPSALLFTIGLRAFLFDFPSWKPSAPISSPTAERTARQ